MAARKVRPILAEMLYALDGIEAAAAGKSLEDFREDWLLKHGVQRGIEIISEAARHIPDELLQAAPGVPWEQVRESVTYCATSITRLRTLSSGRL